MERIIFHIDVNSAFLSWSALKQLHEHPGSVDLRTVPSVVGGDQATRHGIVTAKSIPAKKYGIKTAMPVAEAMRRCPGLVIVPSDFATYRSYSRQFVSILRKYAPVVEKASIDEAYLDMSGTREKYGSAKDGQEPFPVNIARTIKDEIKDVLGFTVNVGISSNKLLAKMASDFEKPDRIHTLWPKEIPEKMWPLPIGELYGCGEKTARRLIATGIRTIGEAAMQPPELLQSLLGEKGGMYIWRSANGISESPVTDERGEAKSYSNEETTSRDITAANYETDFPPLLEKLAGKVAGRLQRDNVYAGTIGLDVKTSDFKRRSIQMKLPDPTNSQDTIYTTLRRLADRFLMGEEGLLFQVPGIRLAGVKAADLTHGEYRQLTFTDLFADTGEETEDAEDADDTVSTDTPDQEELNRTRRNDALAAMTEQIRKKYGGSAISRGMVKETDGEQRRS